MSRINYFKSKISLIDYVLSRPDLGFKISDKSKKNEIVIYRETDDSKGNTIKSDNLLISRFNTGNESFDYFFKTDDDFKKSKSVVDFIHEFVLNKNESQPIDYAKIFGILDEYIKSDNYIDPNQSNFELREHTKRESIQSPDNLRELVKQPTQEVFDYLKSRHIAQSTYMNPLFLATYGTYTHIINNEKENKQFSFRRPVFLFVNSNNKLQTFQQIIDSPDSRQKLFLKDIDKGESLFKSHKTSKTNTIVLVEAPEKTMAHFQLSEEQFEQRNIVPYYLATGGNMSQGQLLHISNIVNESKMNLIIGYDNDKAGELYSIKTLATFVHPDLISLSTKTINNQLYLGFEINNIKTESIGNNKFELILKGKETIINVIASVDYKSRVSQGKVTYLPYSTELSNKIISDLSKTIGENLNISIVKHTSLTKDWVDDLERKETLKREVHVHPRIPNFKTEKHISL